MKIGKEITLSKKEYGKYKSFPTLIRAGNEIIMAYREGFADTTKPHGKNGCVKILKSKDLNNWEETVPPFCNNEIDAIISGPFGNYLFLATRSYEYKKRNDVYISRFKLNGIPQKRQILRFKDTDFTMFGHIIGSEDELISPAYGIYKGVDSPILFSSYDLGQTWQIKSLITPNGHEPVLNETSIVKLDNKFLSIMRSREPSYDLYYTFSKNLIDWDKPVKLGFLGHAPIIRELSDKRLAFVFRDLNDDLPGVGLAVSTDGFSWERFNILHYTGNLYNGGYADFVEIKDGVLLVVYYTSDYDDEPWIEGKVIKV